MLLRQPTHAAPPSPAPIPTTALGKILEHQPASIDGGAGALYVAHLPLKADGVEARAVHKQLLGFIQRSDPRCVRAYRGGAACWWPALQAVGTHAGVHEMQPKGASHHAAASHRSSLPLRRSILGDSNANLPKIVEVFVKVGPGWGAQQAQRAQRA